MKYDAKLQIATGSTVDTKIWKNRKWLWSKLVEKLEQEHKTNETAAEYQAASKDDRSKIKDVGGYVGGQLRNGRRKPENVVCRQLLTLDIDFAHLDVWDDFTMQFQNAAVIHSTHSHSEKQPKYRLIMPLSRECTPDEYVAIARRVAGLLDIEIFDKTTFQTNRLMFWPSTSKDAEYYCEVQDGPFVDADEMLATYSDWKDSSQWPTSESQLQDVKSLANKQQDPEIKNGIVGIFCRSFNVHQAIEKFLKDTYIPADDGSGKYTYAKGSTSLGLHTYNDGKFAYSYHGTDPISLKLCNAFDLVRIHRFGHLDPANTTVTGKKLQSYKAMENFARESKEVRRTIASESINQSKYDFAEDYEDTATEEDNLDWAEDLQIDGRGKYLSSAPNLNLIFANDTRLRNLFKRNDFDSKSYVFGSMPWRNIKQPEPIRNVDFAGIRNYIETIYGIVGTQKIDDSLTLEFEKQSFHPVKDYLNGLKWDGEKRVDTMLSDYFGVPKSLYHKEAARKTLCGGVARIFNPGIKFELMLTLVGPQGTGKSTFIKKLAGPWFSDSFSGVTGNASVEQLQGAWIMEVAELAGMRRADVEAIKKYISAQEDTFRAAYQKTVETIKRQCIYIGTTNNKDFLTDSTGNRRFLPVDIDIENATKSVFDMSQEDVDQLWAEAVTMYKSGEKLFLSARAESLAKVEQDKHSQHDERLGIIENYLEMLLPEDWDKKDPFERRAYIEDYTTGLSEKGVKQRNFVCIAEIWCECLGHDKKEMNRYKTREINEMVKSLSEWEKVNSTKNFKHYGKQKFYARKFD